VGELTSSSRARPVILSLGAPLSSRLTDVSAACGMLAARDIPKANHEDLEDLKEDNSIS
jgi:hypothetical protein